MSDPAVLRPGSRGEAVRDLLAKEPAYDPQAAAISSAFVSSFNDYVRRDLRFGRHRHRRLRQHYNWRYRGRRGFGRAFGLRRGDKAAGEREDPQLHLRDVEAGRDSRARSEREIGDERTQDREPPKGKAQLPRRRQLYPRDHFPSVDVQVWLVEAVEADQPGGASAFH